MKSGGEWSRHHFSRSDPPPRTVTAQQPALPRPREHLRLHPLVTLSNRRTKTKKKKAQMTEHFKAPEKTQLSEEEIANLSDAQFKTLVIKTLAKLVEFV